MNIYFSLVATLYMAIVCCSSLQLTQNNYCHFSWNDTHHCTGSLWFATKKKWIPVWKKGTSTRQHSKPITKLNFHDIRKEDIVRLKVLSQLAMESLICMIPSWSFSLSFTLHFCISEIAMYITSVGAFGIIFSMAILFLVVHRAHIKPENRKMINLAGTGPLPLSQEPQKSSQEVG